MWLRERLREFLEILSNTIFLSPSRTAKTSAPSMRLFSSRFNNSNQMVHRTENSSGCSFIPENSHSNLNTWPGQPSYSGCLFAQSCPGGIAALFLKPPCSQETDFKTFRIQLARVVLCIKTYALEENSN